MFPARTTLSKSLRLSTLLYLISSYIHSFIETHRDLLDFPFSMFSATPLPGPFPKAPHPSLRTDDLKFGLFLTIPTGLPAPSPRLLPLSLKLHLLTVTFWKCTIAKSSHSTHACTGWNVDWLIILKQPNNHINRVLLMTSWNWRNSVLSSLLFNFWSVLWVHYREEMLNKLQMTKKSEG